MNFILLGLITTPSFSIVSYFGGFYLPNHLIAIALIFLFSVSKFGIKKNSLIIAVVLAMGTLPSVLNSFQTSTAHFFLVWVVLLLSSGIIKIDRRDVLHVLIMQLIIAGCQTFLINLNYQDIVYLFMSNPVQEGYVFDKWSHLGLYRVAGGFLESSQLATYALFTASLYRDDKIMLFLSSLVILITGSIIGFIGLIFIYALVLKYNFKTILLTLSAFIIIGLLAYDVVLWRITHSSIFSQNDNLSVDRLGAILNTFSFENISLFGEGLAYRHGWDIFSIFLPSFGIVGLIPILILSVHIIRRANKSKVHWFLVSLSFLINGSLIEPIYQYLYLITNRKLKKI